MAHTNKTKHLVSNPSLNLTQTFSEKDFIPKLGCQSTSDLHRFHFKYVASKPTGSYQWTPEGPFGGSEPVRE